MYRVSLAQVQNCVTLAQSTFYCKVGVTLAGSLVMYHHSTKLLLYHLSPPSFLGKTTSLLTWELSWVGHSEWAGVLVGGLFMVGQNSRQQ